MKIFYAKLSDSSTILKPADRMEIFDDAIRVYQGEQLVAYADLGTVLYAHIYEKGEK